MNTPRVLLVGVGLAVVVVVCSCQSRRPVLTTEPVTREEIAARRAANLTDADQAAIQKASERANKKR